MVSIVHKETRNGKVGGERERERERGGGGREERTRDTAGKFLRELLHKHVIDVFLHWPKNDNRSSVAPWMGKVDG